MATSVFGKTWDDATAPAISRLAQEYEEAFRSGRRPDLSDFLPADPSSRSAELTALFAPTFRSAGNWASLFGSSGIKSAFPILTASPWLLWRTKSSVSGKIQEVVAIKPSISRGFHR